MRVRLLFVLVALILSACGSEQPTATPTAPVATIAPTPTSPPVVAVATDTPQPPTATIVPTEVPTDTPLPKAADVATIIAALKTAGLPIGPTTIYNASTDPNHLLGRPNQYTAKASWHDTRLPTPANPQAIEVSNGGGIEIWPDADSAKKRAEYITALGKGLPMLVEYDYTRGSVLLRVSGTLTPDQAAEYEKAFNAVVGP